MQHDLPKVVFTFLSIGILIIATFWIIEPFILGALWALMVVIATWPLLIFLQKLLFNKRYLATSVLILLISLIFVIPAILGVNHIVDNNEVLTQWVKDFSVDGPPELNWLNDIPFIGVQLYTTWHQLITGNGSEIFQQIQPYIGQSATWLIQQISNIGYLLIHLFLMIIFCTIFYQKGEIIAQWILRFSFRIAGVRGENATILAAQAIRAVALGIVVTALVQTLIACLALYLTHVPYYTILTVLLFICCVAQIGPLLILVPSVAWLYWNNSFIEATILLLVAILLSTIDNVLRPILIRKGINLPLPLVFLGVIGGLFAFGLIGLFIGPVVLAVSYRLISAWIDEDKNGVQPLLPYINTK